MSALSLSRYLPDFSTHRITDADVEILPAPPPAAEPDARLDHGPDAAERAAVADIIALEEEKRRAFEAGRAEGRGQAEALYEAEKARIMREHAAAMEEMRAAFAREQALLLAGSLTEALTALEAGFSAQIADILMPLLAGHMERAAVAEFAGRVAAAALADAAPEISGPARLLEPLSGHAALLPPGCRFAVNDADELSLSFGDQVLETRIAPLLDELKAAVT